MSEETVVPFLNAAAKRTNDELVERMKDAVACLKDTAANQDVDVVTNMLKALEDLHVQVEALIDLAVEFDKRIEKLEKAKPGRIISAR